MLLSRGRGNPDETIFRKRGDENVPMSQVSGVFIDTVNELKLNLGVVDRKQKVTFHTLRHSFGTYLYGSTHDIYLTQKSLGHATATMTARYAKMTDTRLYEGAQAVENVFLQGKKDPKAGKGINFKKKGGRK
jgi:integrase